MNVFEVFVIFRLLIHQNLIMKNTTLACFFLISGIVFSQENNTNVKATVKVDEFTKTKTIQTERWSRFGQNELGNILNANLICISDGVIAISIIFTGDLGCLSENRSRLLVKLANDEIVEFTQITQTDCSKTPTATFIPLSSDQLKTVNNQDEILAIIEENIELLMKFNWVTIRLHGSRFYTDINPNPTRQVSNPEQFFIQHIKAIKNQFEM